MFKVVLSFPDSKKDFGLRLIERYAQFFAKKLDRHLRNSALSRRQIVTCVCRGRQRVCRAMLFVAVAGLAISAKKLARCQKASV